MGNNPEIFRNEKCAKLCNEINKFEEIAEFRIFYYRSLKEDDLDLFDEFIQAGIYKFYGFHCDYYPDFI